jgi:hypothetical protein
MSYLYVPYIISYDEGNSMYSDYYNEEAILKIKKFNPGTLTQILLFYDIYVFYDEPNNPLEDISNIKYSIDKNSLVLNDKYSITDDTIIYSVSYDDRDSENQLNVSELLSKYEGNEDEYDLGDLAYDHLRALYKNNHIVLYSREGITELTNELLTILKRLRSQSDLIDLLKERSESNHEQHLELIDRCIKHLENQFKN